MENVLASISTILATTAARWQGLAQSLPADRLERPPAAGEWSARACLQHLVDAERLVFPVRIEALLAGRDFPAFDPDNEGSEPGTRQHPGELAAEFERLRNANLELVDKLTEADLGRRARHAELGLVTLSELLHEWAGHDLMHAVQAERALMQPFIEGCGPWRPYFADHLARQG